MIFKGTPTRGIGEISREINNAGGEINAYTAHNRTVFHTTLPSQNWQIGLDALADAMMHASFPEEEWKREREVILRELAMGEDDPSRVLGKLLWGTAYRVHPYRYPVIGYEDIFKTMTREDLVTFFSRNYVPDNMITVVVGDIDAKEVEAHIHEVFDSFQRRARLSIPLPKEPVQLAPRFARETGPYKVSRLHMAWHITSFSDPDTPALDVLAAVVGAGRSSRLVKKIKEEDSLVYGISAWSATPKEPGLFGISATFDPANEQAVIDAIQAEIAQWKDKPFTKEEIDKARRMVLVGELSELQTVNGQAVSYASGEFYAADPRFAETYLHNVEQVTPEKLNAVIGKYLTPDNQTLVILSPPLPDTAKTAIPQIKKKPVISKEILPHGVTLIVREDHRLPFTYICATLKGGLLSEKAENNGITQLMSELLTRGTASRSAEEIAALTEQLGGSLTVFSGRNSFGLQARCLSRDTDTFIDLLTDCLIHPSFPENELEKQRTIQLASIQQQHERPIFIAQEALREMLFPDHPYQWTPIGKTESVQQLTRTDLIKHAEQLILSSNLVLSVFGDITKERAAELVKKYIADLPSGPAPKLDTPEPIPNLPAKSVKREPKEQAILLIGYPGIDIFDPRRDAIEIINQSLSGMSSDLFSEVREKRGLVYYIGAYSIPGLEPGMIALYAGTREEAVEEVQHWMDVETDRIAGGGLREEELARAKERIVAAYQMSLQDNAGLAQTCALNELYGLGYDYTFSTRERMEALTLKDIKQAAASIFTPARRAISIVLPEETMQDGGKEQ